MLDHLIIAHLIAASAKDHPFQLSNYGCPLKLLRHAGLYFSIGVRGTHAYLPALMVKLEVIFYRSTETHLNLFRH